MAIKNSNPNISDFFNFKEVNETDIENKLDSKTSTGEDQIPTKLVILAKDYLVKPLKHAINSSIRNNTFPNKAKYAAVAPLDKGGKDKTSVTNYRPISVLNVFSKFYEKIMKEQITHGIKILFLTFCISVKNYSTQHVLTNLIEEWKEKLDKNYVVGAVPHDLIIAKLSAYGFEHTALESFYLI